jgi:predicted RNA binding protein YcfA (HicA-like mRNA interferase family)
LRSDTISSIIQVSKAGKLLERMRANPRGWRIESLETIARRHGLQVRKTGGSHFVFLHPESDIAVSVPFNRPIKPVYIVQFLALIDDIGAHE